MTDNQNIARDVYEDAQMSGALERVDRLWRCTGCGYFAYSLPVEDIVDDEGKHAGAVLHVCPECGERCWHWCGGDSREKRVGYLQELLRG